MAPAGGRGLEQGVGRLRAAVAQELRAPLRLGCLADGVGGGTELIPDADPSDGELDVIVSHAISGLSRLVYALRLRAGSQKLMKEVVHASGQRVEVEGEDFYVTSDGELSGPHRRRAWALREGAVEMWLPARHTV